MIYEDQPVILVVDDVPANIKVLANALRQNYRIKMALNGIDALEAAQSEPYPDLILLDVMMPDLDGYEVCRRLKEDPLTRKIPVIFVTAKNLEQDEEIGFNVGGVDYITKPFSIPITRARIRTHILLKRQADVLEKLAHSDPLTGIANRRQFGHTFAMEWKRAAREDKPLSVLMIDIDYFKAYNDHYGHGAGDDCLRQVAVALAKGVCRPGDLVARYGGEEFVVILPETDAVAARQLAGRLKNAVLQLKLPHQFSEVESVVSVSIGCATTELFTKMDSPKQLLARADQMLYRAKEMGRNQVS